MFAISARFAPLPPSRFFISFVPSALPPPKKNVRFDSFPAFFKIAVFPMIFPITLALTLIPFLWPFLWPFFNTTFLGFSDLSLFLARLGMGAHIPCQRPPRKALRGPFRSISRRNSSGVDWARADGCLRGFRASGGGPGLRARGAAAWRTRRRRQRRNDRDGRQGWGRGRCRRYARRRWG